MMIKALIFDFDNTIFPSKTITDEVFSGVYALMENYRGTISKTDFENIKKDLAGTAFQKVAQQYHLPQELKQKAIELLNHTVYNKPIETFKDYKLVRELGLPKFLVTFGFLKLQQSKIDCAGVRNDFKEVIVVDPELSSESKQDVFRRIVNNYNFQADELIAIGDDPASEIAAARELGIKTYLYDPESRHKSERVTWHAQHYQKLVEILTDSK